MAELKWIGLAFLLPLLGLGACSSNQDEKCVGGICNPCPDPFGGCGPITNPGCGGGPIGGNCEPNCCGYGPGTLQRLYCTPTPCTGVGCFAIPLYLDHSLYESIIGNIEATEPGKSMSSADQKLQGNGGGAGGDDDDHHPQQSTEAALPPEYN